MQAKEWGIWDGRWKFFHILHSLQDVHSSLQHAAAPPEPANSSQGFRVYIQILCLQRFVAVRCRGDAKIDKLNSVKEISLCVKVLCLWEIFVPCMITVGSVRGRDIHDWSMDINTIWGWNVQSARPNHHNSIKILDYNSFVAYFAEDYTADTFLELWSITINFIELYFLMREHIWCKMVFDREVLHKAYSVGK